jgi:S-adenosylmethionine decarboxylase proenzyme
MKLTHIAADFAGVDRALLDDPQRLLEVMTDSVGQAGLTPVATCAHKFTPLGVSAVVILAESHISIHTWPEEGFAAVDLLSCGSESAAREAIELLRVRLGATQTDLEAIRRGALLSSV